MVFVSTLTWLLVLYYIITKFYINNSNNNNNNKSTSDGVVTTTITSSSQQEDEDILTTKTITTTTTVITPVSFLNIDCPNIYGSYEIFNITSIPTSITISIPNNNNNNNEILCTLVLKKERIYNNNNNDITTNNDNNIPIARSYDGNNWERSGSTYVSTWDEWVCDSNDSKCTTILYSMGTYILHNHNIISTLKIANIARFLEQSTFGATKTLLDNITTMQYYDDNDNFPISNYIYNQIYNIQPTLHRVYYRKRMNAIWYTQNYPNFPTLLSPCEQTTSTTTWRKQIINEKDRNKNIQLVQANKGWKIYIDGYLRSWVSHDLRILNRPNYNFTNGQIIKVCSSISMLRRGILKVRINKNNKNFNNNNNNVFTMKKNNDDEDNNVFTMENNDDDKKVLGACVQVIADDWIVDFPTNFRPPSIISGTLESLSNSNSTTSSKWKLISNFLPEYLYTGIINPNQCSTITSKNGEKSNTNIIHDDIQQPLFAKTIDGEWLLYDPRIILYDNTIYNPLYDGGNTILQSEHVEYCSNVNRNYQNEKYCTMSNYPTCHVGTKSKKASTYTIKDSGGIVCGSPGEVANDLSLGDNWLDMHTTVPKFAYKYNIPKDTTPALWTMKQREYIWTNIVLKSEDQLRQRMAWSLSQIFSLQKSIYYRDFNTEHFIHYYDIFVRNAFNNYYDILRDITYSPLMGKSLSYSGSMSVGMMYMKKNITNIYPDENFARELMQLFTIGLNMLNIDGTPILDNETKKPIKTYDNDDIMSFARAWTGFVYAPQRSNKEDFIGNISAIDPMIIVTKFRDHFPKTNLYNNGYIGDGYPLCSNLPDKHFLKIGAIYRILGSSTQPELASENKNLWSTPKSAKIMTITSDSELYNILCKPTTTNPSYTSSKSNCTYPGYIELDNNLKCTGNECLVDTVRVVKVNDVHYEYVRIPCVEQSFYQNPRMATTGLFKRESAICISGDLTVASEACCDQNLFAQSTTCVYARERVTFATAEQRCLSLGKQHCDYTKLELTKECRTGGLHWTNLSCQLQVKVSKSGQIAIVHSFEDGSAPDHLLKPDTPAFFGAYWENDRYPTVENGCDGAMCTVYKDTCLCNVTASHNAAFTSTPSSTSEIINALKIGHAPPDMYENDAFVPKQMNDYIYYSKNGACCTIDTVFEVLDHNGMKRFLKNEISTVSIDGSDYKFRNPVQFNSIAPTEHTIGDAAYETEAVLRHLFEHPNTAPFVSYRLIQRFGISNPSPRYVKVVAEAFRDGKFTKDAINFGSGEYGDLAATVAAILLDREARSNSLTFDPSHGSLREQILKVIAFMRAMEFNSGTPLVELDMMSEKVGQMAHNQPTVFSFFRPEYTPPGVASAAHLVAPEAEILSSGKVVGILNGLFSLAKYSRENCNFQFAAYPCEGRRSSLLDYNPSDSDNLASIVEDLSILLTSGRLDDEKQATIVSAVQNESDPTSAMRLALQLFATLPEFHSTNRADVRQEKNPSMVSSSEVKPLDTKYKAVIHLSLDGGCDSFNVLTPNPTCFTLSNQYKVARDNVALKDTELLELGGDTTGQPCTTFGLHHSLPYLKQLYDEGDLLFVANAGVMTKPVTLENYRVLTETQLFAHNAMQDEVKRLDPFNTKIGTGTLGRIVDILETQGYKVGRTSIEASILNLASLSPESPSIVTVDERGVDPLEIDPPSLGLYMEILNGGLSGKSSGIYGETWSELLRESRNQTDDLHYLLLNNPTTTKFNQTSSLSKHLSLVAQLIGTREARGAERDFFFVSMGGFDMHPEVTETLQASLSEVNAAINEFITEIKALGLWDDVVIVQTSEFGRTIVPNSGGGTDHGWGGNYWITGGDVKGGKILGKYPNSFHESDMDRGRIIPTTPFDSIFNAIAEWVGIDSNEDLNTILPNRNSFPTLFSAMDLFG